ncbi:hypothetical protein HDV06_006076 [Boothiomyces sp. JEL0866]|nr:hypothetical protein HDV06_006026 [Boothiomyces sp. JEL0866]KAJ3324818.1 hypothetical protein HDV06_006076 [Boothiomyces sp. JEL0866]
MIVLLGEDKSIQHTLIGSASAHRKYQEHLIGNTLVKGTILVDPEDGRPKLFFVYSDLHIKTPGLYRFQCNLIDCNQNNIISYSVITDLFEIHKLNGFKKRLIPCMLTNSFRLQGFEVNPKKSKITYNSPIPIFQLEFENETKKTKLLSFNFLCNVVLIGEDNYIQQTLIASRSAHRTFQENLLGQTTIEGRVLVDPEDGRPKIFFIFSDLYIKTPGCYRLKCQLIDLNQPEITVEELTTELFNIYKLNEYKKENVHTMLSKSFELQGVELKQKRKS